MRRGDDCQHQHAKCGQQERSQRCSTETTGWALSLYWYQSYAGNKLVARLEEEGGVRAFLLWKYEKGCKPQESASVVLTVMYGNYTELYSYQQVSAHFLWGLFLGLGFFVFDFGLWLFIGQSLAVWEISHWLTRALCRWVTFTRVHTPERAVCFWNRYPGMQYINS